MAAIFKRVNFFENCRVGCSDTLWVENFDEIALSCTVKETKTQICVFAFVAPIQKFKMAAIFGERKFF